jgi:cation transport regulator ChaC
MRIYCSLLQSLIVVVALFIFPHSLALKTVLLGTRNRVSDVERGLHKLHHLLKMSGTEESASNNAPRWDPEQQIYVDGVVPENFDVKALIEKNNGSVRLFGYGSLCWNPGTGPLAHPGVVSTLGRARGYKRCWAQGSTDHRGTPSFPGIVCTLLEDREVHEIRKAAKEDTVEYDEKTHEPTLTEGVIYLIPPELVDECLAELDFREKGGYARDVIDVVEDKTGETHQALLYRGTPDNPAIWPRALLDLPFAAGRFQWTCVLFCAKAPIKFAPLCSISSDSVSC